MQKAVDKAIAATQDAKKATKNATWINLGKAYLAAYQNPLAEITPGLDKTNFSLINKEKPISTSTVTLADGGTFEKMQFNAYDAYFNEAGMLMFLDVTKPSVPGDLLGEAAKAYLKAYELGAKEKDIDEKLQEITNNYFSDAYTQYQIGNNAKASDLFKGAADVSFTPPCSAPNQDMVYNTAFTAFNSGNIDRADEYFKKCLDIDYTKNGDIYASLAKVSLAKADTLAAKNYLATGLTAYPNNSTIITDLINLYLQTNEDPKKIVALLDDAKKAMPDNPSLYYVEGNILSGIKDYDGAFAAYSKANEIDPEYDMAYYGLANISLKKGEDLIQQIEAAETERNWEKADELSDQLIAEYVKAVEPFEKCYEVSTNETVKTVAADYLKRLCFQLRNTDSKYQAAYEKWEAILKQAKGE